MKKSLIALASLASMGAIAGASFSRRNSDEPRGHELRALNAGGLMANVDSATLNKNDFMQAFGNAVVADGVLALAANPTAADVLRVMKVLAGTKVSALMIGNPEIDTNASAEMVVSWGYAPVVAGDGPTAAPTYFHAAGDTVLQNANPGKLYCNFAPITFDKDVYITATVGTDAATFAAGSIYVQALGEARGIK